MNNTVWFLVISALVTGCFKTNTASQPKEFATPNYNKSEPAAFAGIPLGQKAAELQANQVTFENLTGFGSRLAYLKVKFTGLNQSQCEKLKDLYASQAGSRSQVPCGNGNQDYELEDFLPPAMQALAKHRFNQQRENVEHLSLPDTPSNLQTVSNCWGTAWEITRLGMRREQKTPGYFHVFYADSDMFSALRNDKYSHSRKTLASTAGDQSFGALLSANRNDGLLPGDVMLITRGTGTTSQLVHAAIVLDHDLYFEKTGIEDSTPYHVTSYEAILKEYGTHANQPTQIEWRRFSSEIPAPQDLFAKKDVKGMVYTQYSEEQGYPVIPVKISIDAATGRGRLDPEAEKKSYFDLDKSCGTPCFNCKLRHHGDSDSIGFDILKISERMETAFVRISTLNENGKVVEISPRGGVPVSREPGKNLWSGTLGGNRVTVKFEGWGLDTEVTVEGFDPPPLVTCARM